MRILILISRNPAPLYVVKSIILNGKRISNVVESLLDIAELEKN